MAKNGLAYAALGAGALYLFYRTTLTSAADAPLLYAQPMQNIIPAGYRIDGIINPVDIGTTKVLKNVMTETALQAQYERHKANNPKLRVKDWITYKNAPTATAAIKAAVKVLPTKQSDELKNNLRKLGW